ncbi:hypothetical protein [Novosphingobium album (ex Liu et al. 2023)]|uniref:Uncharacterized protein n=1 Tax=Novosphingobium album (ex Liu et al. 2023) TaxID=3031130 RepID=A0ABT5WNJ3_9SPHN|nr:hypothetical protein [Novosphingobium album (ex Liu et al. 2023)]MDE8651621.1 hypothetical protein [Novosphingobium album (ex Liu et al. 2023)]
MEIAFDLVNCTDGLSGAARERASDHPEWPVLHARLVAARESFSMLSKDFAVGTSRRRGSFADEAAHRLATYGHVSTTVNPSALVNGKPEADNDALVAGTTRTGGRG